MVRDAGRLRRIAGCPRIAVETLGKHGRQVARILAVVLATRTTTAAYHACIHATAHIDAVNVAAIGGHRIIANDCKLTTVTPTTRALTASQSST